MSWRIKSEGVQLEEKTASSSLYSLSWKDPKASKSHYFDTSSTSVLPKRTNKSPPKKNKQSIFHSLRVIMVHRMILHDIRSYCFQTLNRSDEMVWKDDCDSERTKGGTRRGTWTGQVGFKGLMARVGFCFKLVRSFIPTTNEWLGSSWHYVTLPLSLSSFPKFYSFH